MWFVFWLLIQIVTSIAHWRLFQKMGFQGWQGVIPGYNYDLVCKAFYNNGWKVFMALIPGYNIYVLLRLRIDMARAFNKSTGYGVGFFFADLYVPVFTCMLAFSSAKFLDGSMEVVGNDPIYRACKGSGNSSASTADYAANPQPRPTATRKDPGAMQKLKDLSELYERGLLTAEEFNEKKAELLKKL